MRFFIYLYILKLIAQTESATNPKAVNVQLETILEFNDKDKDADVKFIGNIQKILKKVKTALSPESGRRSLSNYYSNDKHIQFTDFLLAAVDILLSYDDDDLENAFTILDEEIRKYHYKGCKFYELVEDENVRKLVARNLEDLKKNKAKTLRRKLYKLVNLIENSKLNSKHKQFLDYINSLYRHESSKTFVNILQNIENYSYKSKRSNMNWIEITRHGIRSVLFDYFSKLSPNVRKDIKKNIENTFSNKKNKKTKLRQTNKYNEDDFVDKTAGETQSYNNSKEDKSGPSSSTSNERNIKINILNDMDTNAVKKNHAMVRHALKQKHIFLTPSPVKNRIKQPGKEYPTKELTFEPLWKEKKNKQKGNLRERDDFLIPIDNSELKPHSFEKKERKEKKKRSKKNKTKANKKKLEDSVRVEKKRKKNKHQSNLEDTVTMKEEKRKSVRSESSMKRHKTGSHEDIFIDFNMLHEKRHSDEDLETNAPPRKRKNRIKRKQFKYSTVIQNVQSHSDEGMSIEDGNYRRIMSSDRDSEMDNEKDNERHKVSAEIIRKQFISRINNLEKQMEEMVRKNDDTPKNDNIYEVDKKTTEEEGESSTEILHKLNKTLKTNTTSGTTLSYHIIIGPEYIPYNDNISNKTPSTEVNDVITNSFNITDNGKSNISFRQNSIVSEEAFHTDFDYSEAGIMKKLNLNFTLPEEKPKSNESVIEEKPKKPETTGDEIKGNNDNNKNENGLHRIEIPIDNENKIMQNNKTEKSEIRNLKV